MKNLITLIVILFCSSGYSQIVDIPDPGFKAFLIAEGIDDNGDGEIQVSEAEDVENMSIHSSNTEINSIEGIKAFANLQFLDIDYININSLDISGMGKLTTLNISASEIWNIDAKNCVGLKTVHLLDPQTINSADFSGCTSLEKVDGSICAEFLTFTNCTALKKLTFFHCQLFELDLTGCENLTYFEAFDLNPDFNFDFTAVPALDTFILFGHNTSELEVVNVPNLKYLSLDEVGSLIVRNCPNLEEVEITMGNSVDIVGLPMLTNFSFLTPTPSFLRIEECPLLQSFPLYGEFGEIIIKNCPTIETLEFMGGTSAELWDFTGLSSLVSITATTGPRELILDGCYSLESFAIVDSNAKTFDFSPCINLMTLNLGSVYNLENLIIQNSSMESIIIESIDNLKTVCVDPDEVIQIQTYLNTFLNNEAIVTTSCEFASGGKPFKLSGFSYLDVNEDSCKTSNVTLPFSKYVLSEDIIGDRTFFTNEDGQYNYNVFEGQFTYGPELLFGDYIFTTTPENRTVEFPAAGTEVIQDFCFIPSAEEVDVIEVHLIPLDIARPGFDSRYLITYTNTGNVTRGGEIKLTFQDEFMDFLMSEPMATVLEEGFISWSFEDLIPYETRSIEFTMNLNSPMDTPPLNGGDILNFKAEVGPYGNQTLTVYWSHLNQEVVNSFDPNDKTCLNGNAFDQELVGDYLKYMIRFENTGTAEAVNIVVTDTLDDTKFDVRTLQVINASHEVETELTDNVIKFIFKDIYLPFEDETNDGYVTFKIKTLPSLVLGDDIQNKAEIFFDFNFPIVTNTTSTIISDFTTVDDLEQSTFDLEFSPNPASESILIQTETEMNRIGLFDVSGRLLKGVSFTGLRNSFNLSIDQLTTGIYLIKVYSENGYSVGKLIKK